MKIAYVITRSDEIGGAHIHVRDLALWMQQKGYEVKVFVGGSGVFTEKLLEVNLPFQSLNYMQRSISLYRDYKAINELVDALQEYNPNLVSIHSAKAGMIARLACRRIKIPCIFTAHGWSFARGTTRPKQDVFLWIERVLAPISAKIISVCDNDREFALRFNLCKATNIRTIHNGMPEVPSDLIATHNNQIPCLIMVARFEYPKNHKILFDVLSNLKDLEWNLTLVGDGPLMNGMIDHARALGILDRINFLGRRWDVAEILAQSDLFILTTFWEGFPRSIIEAMRAGLPVVASDVAGIPEAVKHESTGFLLRGSYKTDLESRLRFLITNSDIRKNLGVNGRRMYESLFTFDAMANKTLQLYQEVLSEVSR